MEKERIEFGQRLKDGKSLESPRDQGYGLFILVRERPPNQAKNPALNRFTRFVFAEAFASCYSGPS
jgi:hypothetical protein